MWRCVEVCGGVVGGCGRVVWEGVGGCVEGCGRACELAQRQHWMGGELDAEGGRPVDDIVVQLREHLHEVQPVTDECEA